jgi:capsular polysaccharide biosynthesis protein/tellurite resistance protein
MREQALNLRTSVQIVRRHKILIFIVAVAGVLLGISYSMLRPPMLASTATVVIPQAVQNADTVAGAATSTTGNGPDPYMATQVVIAGSDPVLSGALPNISPAISLETLRSRIKVTSPTTGILSFGAKGRTAAQAEATADAVANSYIAFIGAKNGPAGAVSAHLLNQAVTATGTAPVEHMGIYALIGAVIGGLIGIIAALVISRADRQLRTCDEIAASIGVPVLTSFPVDHPSSAGGWTKLLEDYKPRDLDAWRLRNALHQLDMAGFDAGYLGDGGNSSLAVVSLSCDPGALAVGPQLAVFAASLGIATALVIGPQQVTEAMAALRTACAVSPPESSKRSAHLHVVVADGGLVDLQPESALTIVVAVVDAATPRVADATRTTMTVLGVSAGATTADQLARTALAVAADGSEIAGILVADPEPADHTTGRNPQQTPVKQRSLLGRARGMTTEIRR